MARLVFLELRAILLLFSPNVPIELLRTFPSDLTVDICGLTLELVHLGGLAKDEIGLWWPDQRIFLASDSIGLQIPDLFPIHGGPQRYRDKYEMANVSWEVQRA